MNDAYVHFCFIEIQIIKKNLHSEPRKNFLMTAHFCCRTPDIFELNVSHDVFFLSTNEENKMHDDSTNTNPIK